MYFANINFLRGFAALSVLVSHVIIKTEWHGFPATGVLSWFRIGWMGVDLFFAISGFVITYSALVAFRQAPTEFSAHFVRRRIARIAPLYLLTMVFYLVFIEPQLLALPRKELFWQLATHLLFIHNFFPATNGAINGVNWSIATEMQFYVCVLLGIRWLDKAKPWQIGAILVTTAWGWRYLAFVQFSGDADIVRLDVYSKQLPGMLDEFAAGIVLARVVLDRGIQTLGIRSVFNWLPLFGWLLALGLTVWLALHVYWQHAVYWDNLWMVTFWRSLAALALVAILGSALALPQLTSSRFAHPFSYLGEISYGIYLWHMMVIVALLKVGGLPPSQVLQMTLVFSLLFAAWSWHQVEQPVIRRFR